MTPANERYTGNSIWQKYYTTDSLPFRKVQNHGERESYYAEGTHEAIISDAEFNAANKLMQERAAKSGPTEMKSNIFQKKITCGVCGSRFRRKEIRGRNYWVCVGHDKKQTDCPTTQIPESEIQAAFLRLYYKLRHQGTGILAQLLTNLHTIRSHRMLWSTDIIELNKRISNITSQNQLLAVLKQQGSVDPDIFISRSNELAEQLRTAKQEKERLLKAESDEMIPRTRELLEIIEASPDILDEFDGELFGELVKRIIVESNERLRFQLKNGLELAEYIEKTVR